jgi:hypothetical protein
MIKRLQLKSLLADRGYLMAIAGMALLLAAVAIIAAVYVRPGELRVPVRYSRFDPKNYTLGSWYSLLGYVGFAVIVFVGHVLTSAKLYQAKGRQFAVAYVSIGSLILVITAVYFLSIAKIVSLTQ